MELGAVFQSKYSFRTRLLMPSGPDALPNFKDRRVSFTSSGVRTIFSSTGISLGIFISGSGVLSSLS